MKWTTILKSRRPKWLLFFFCMMLMQLYGAAQEQAAVTGTVTGDNDELLEGVTVKASSTGSRESYTTVTNARGVFTFQRLKVGSAYTFTVSYIGYDQATVRS